MPNKRVETCPWTGEDIHEGEGAFYSEYNGYWYKTLKAAKKHHMAIGFTEEQVNKMNKNLTIFYTTLA